jgi:hypothetical protein
MWFSLLNQCTFILSSYFLWSFLSTVFIAAIIFSSSTSNLYQSIVSCVFSACTWCELNKTDTNSQWYENEHWFSELKFDVLLTMDSEYRVYKKIEIPRWIHENISIISSCFFYNAFSSLQYSRSVVIFSSDTHHLLEVMIDWSMSCCSFCSVRLCLNSCTRI